MPKVIINQFNGGLADDVRTTSQFKCEKSENFDIFIESFRISPIIDSVTETVDVSTMDDIEMADVTTAYLSGTEYLVSAGYYGTSASVNPAVFIKSSITGTWSRQASGSGTYCKGSLITYKTNAYLVSDNLAGSYTLYKYTGSGSLTSIGTMSATSNKDVITYVDSQSNNLYIFIGNGIFYYDGSSLTSKTSILPLNYTTSSVAPYNSYIAISMNPDSGVDNAMCFLWDKDGTVNDLSAQINLGEGSVRITENLDNNLFFVVSPRNSFSTLKQNKITVLGYAGGAVQVISSINDNSTTSIGQAHVYKARKDNRVYFGFSNSTCIYVFGKNKSGNYVVSTERFVSNGATCSTLGGISIVGDYFFISSIISGLWVLMRTLSGSETATYTGTSTYRTTINSGMYVADRYKDKQLIAVSVAVTGSSSGNSILKYSVDGSDFVSIISESNTTGEHTYESTSEVTNGAPFLSGKEIQFEFQSTGGSKLKEIVYSYVELPKSV